MKKKKLQMRKRRKERSEKISVPKSPIRQVQTYVPRTQEKTIKDYARVFYRLMQNSSGYVDGVTLVDRFQDEGWDLGGSPHFLWRIWRQAENDFPNSIDFFPQSC